MTLPNFLIIGAAKAGTTSLYHYLRQHPQIFMSEVKEPNYFITPQPREDYEKLFAAVTSERAVGEASSLYLNDAEAPARVAEELEEVRLIVSLRNPADRAYSSYLGRLRGARERRSAAEAMRPGTYYFESSLTFAPLSRWLERFGRDRLKIILFDDLDRDAAGVLRDLYRFLGVDPSFRADLAARHNVAAVPRSPAVNAAIVRTAQWVHDHLPPALRDSGIGGRAQRLFLRRPDPLPEAIRRSLIDAFADDIRKTAALIGRDLSPWLE